MARRCVVPRARWLPTTAHVVPRAKRAIFVFLAGGPSQADLFAPKDYITKHHGKAIASPVGDDGQLRVGVAQFLPMAPVAPVRPREVNRGLMISDLLPSLAGMRGRALHAPRNGRR